MLERQVWIDPLPYSVEDINMMQHKESIKIYRVYSIDERFQGMKRQKKDFSFDVVQIYTNKLLTYLLNTNHKFRHFYYRSGYYRRFRRWLIASTCIQHSLDRLFFQQTHNYDKDR